MHHTHTPIIMGHSNLRYCIEAVLHKRHMWYLPGSGATIILGMIFGGIILAAAPGSGAGGIVRYYSSVTGYSLGKAVAGPRIETLALGGSMVSEVIHSWQFPTESRIRFSEGAFSLVLLPIIIFEAGYSITK